MVLCNVSNDYTRFDKSKVHYPQVKNDVKKSNMKLPPLPKATHSLLVNTTNYVPLSNTKSSVSKTSSHGFRLQENQDDTASIYSVYKQKIDLMFTGPNDKAVQKYQEKINNCVQQKIEIMFSEISKDVGEKISELQAAQTFVVDYLGSIALNEKVTSLSGLQNPLKELYFAYKQNVSMDKQMKTLTGRLIISSNGLKVRYQGNNGELEQQNPFPTIAVWSAVKFVLNTTPKSEFAFLPLVTDPENINKNSLFQPIKLSEYKYILNDTHSPLFVVVMKKIGGVSKQLECHGFVCQTSEDAIVIAATLYKSLITFMRKKVINDSKMPKTKNGISCVSIASSDLNRTPVRPPRKKRSTSSIRSDSSSRIEISRSFRNSDRPFNRKTRAAPKMPTPKSSFREKSNSDIQKSTKDFQNKSPRNSFVDDTKEAKKQNSSSEKLSYQDFQKSLDAITRLPDSSFSQNENSEKIELVKNNEKLDKEQSSIKLTASDNSGDIFTKVTIPRSGSFLNAKGLTRYKSINRSNGKTSGGSPIGFHELFNEFRQQEGLNSLDEILGAIINEEGMSFNDLKPIFKEFLLKLSLTLTKDELFQHSKQIMRKQKKKKLKSTNSLIQSKRKKYIVRAKGLKKLFKRSFTRKFKIKRQKLNSNKLNDSLVSLSKIFRCGDYDRDRKHLEKIIPSSSSLSTSSYDTRHFRPKEMTNQLLGKKYNYYRTKRNDLVKEREKSTSEDSDFFTLQRSRSQLDSQNISPFSSTIQSSSLNNTSKSHCNTQNRNSSSGYVSCSECSYDSDACTCISAAKCYCSGAGEQNSTKELHPPPKSISASFDNSTDIDSRLPNPNTTTLSSCKTEDKCYCSLKNQKCKNLKSDLKCQTDLKNNGNKFHHKRGTRRCFCSVERDRSLSWCAACETESCSESTKCYCVVDVIEEPLPPVSLPPATLIEEQLKFFVPNSERELRRRTRRQSFDSLNSSGSRMSRSIHYVDNPIERIAYYDKFPIRTSPVKNNLNNKSSSSDNLVTLDYELFKKDSSQRSGSKLKKKNSRRSTRKSSSSKCNKNISKDTQVTSLGYQEEALSVKKSAEIAAMFADIKLSQTTDISHLIDKKVDNNLNARISNHLEQQRQIIMEQKRHQEKLKNDTNLWLNRANSVSSSGSRFSRGNTANTKRLSTRSNLYNTQNGLYTIQSQSDDSRSTDDKLKKSNETDKNIMKNEIYKSKNDIYYLSKNDIKNENDKDYYSIDGTTYEATKPLISSTNLETSLGLMSKTPPVRGVWVRLRHKSILMPKLSDLSAERYARQMMDSSGEPLSNASDDLSVVDVYDIASDIGKECEKIIDKYGADAVTSLMPKVISTLELLEQLAMKNERENTVINELSMKITQLENDKIERQEYRMKFEKELETIEEQWRRESQELLALVSKLQEENKRLHSVKNETVDMINNEVQSPTQEITMLERLKQIVDKQRDELRLKDKLIQSHSKEIENLTSSNEYLQNNLRDIRRKQNSSQQQIRQLCDERADLLVEMQEKQREINSLKTKLQKAQIENSPKKEVQQDEDTEMPRFTTTELKELFNERNELRTRIADLEHQLEKYLPKNEQNSNQLDEDAPVQGPLPYEPDDAPWKRSSYSNQDSGVRKFFRKLFSESSSADQTSYRLKPATRSLSSTISKLAFSTTNSNDI